MADHSHIFSNLIEPPCDSAFSERGAKRAEALGEKMSDRLYPKLSPAQMDAFLSDFKQAVAAGAVKPPTKITPISPRKPKLKKAAAKQAG